MERNNLNTYRFQVADKEITVYPCAVLDRPAVYLNTFAGEGDKVYQALQKNGCRDFTFVAVSGLLWDHDMAPWDIPPISKNDTPCTGGADEYLRLLTAEIIPKAEDLAGRISWRGLAGYSLAGLFAVYSIYQTNVFSRIASMSGSLWFPGFEDYVYSHKMETHPDHLYLSLGDKESRVRNPYLKMVQERTEAIRDFFIRKSIDTEFRLNPGNHYNDSVQRTAAGIAWILNR